MQVDYTSVKVALAGPARAVGPPTVRTHPEQSAAPNRQVGRAARLLPKRES